MMKAISTVLLVLSTFFGYNQVWVHPMASKLPNQTIVYYLNGDRDPIPEGTSYAYKRLASPRNEYSYFEIEEYYPSGKPYFIGKASEADPISTSYFGNTLWLYESGDTMSFQAYQGKAKQGLFLAKYENGQVKTQGQYHDDEQHGLWLYYSEAGHLSDSGVMEHGKHVGTWVSYSDSGALASTVTYVDGLYEGVRKTFYSNGQLATETTYEASEPMGEAKGYYRDGALRTRSFYDSDGKTGTWLTLNKDGTVIGEANYVKDKATGGLWAVNSRGDTLSSGTYKDEVFYGYTYRYNDQGGLISSARHRNDGAVVYKYFRNDGRLEFKELVEANGTFNRWCFDERELEMLCPQTENHAPVSEASFADVLGKLSFKKYTSFNPRGVYSITVDEHGVVANASVLDEAMDEYDRTIIEALRAMKFEPGTFQGRSVRYQTQVAVRFGADFSVQSGEFYIRDSSVVLRGRGDASSPGIFTIVEEMPAYKGGEAGLFQYIGSTTTFPMYAKEEGIQGVVYIQFVVFSSGVVGHLEILRGVHPSLDWETFRVVEGMDVWTPGRQRGKNVDVYYKLPFRFTLR